MKLLRRMIGKEAGQVLPMALILMLLGGIIIIPTLNFATTNLRATRAVDQHTRELYAADAGVEDALWYLQSEERVAIRNPSDIWPMPTYHLDENINHKDVTVAVEHAWLLKDLPGHTLPTSEPVAPINANNLWTVIGAINIDHTYNYIVDISTSETGTVLVDHIGVWLPQGYSYVAGSVKINGVAVGGNALVKNPDAPVPFRSGNVLIWNYSGKTFQQLSDITPPPPGGGVTPAQKFPPSIQLSFDYTVTPFREARGFYPWINLATGNRIAWDTEAGFYHVVSTSITSATEQTTVEVYVPKGVIRYIGGNSGPSSAIAGDYIVIGNSLMTECWNRHRVGYSYVIDPGPPCNYTCAQHCRGKKFAESSATINNPNAFVPSDAKIEKAYLYWTAWWSANDADKQATLKVNGTLVGTNGAVAADTWYVLPTSGSNGYQYACFANVTDQVKAITTAVNGTVFTLADIDAVPASTCATTPLSLQATNAGWSMIIIYSSLQPQVQVHQIYLYDQLAYLWGLNGASEEFTILGFQAPATGNRDAKLGIFVAEGDPHITPDYFEFRGQQSAGYVYLGDHNTTDPNPWNNVYNSYSTSTGFTPSTLDGQASGTISGVDLDVYTQDRNANLLSSIIQPNDTQAKVRVRSVGSGSGCDGIMLVYIVFSVASTAVSPGEEFNVGSMLYRIQ